MGLNKGLPTVLKILISTGFLLAAKFKMRILDVKLSSDLQDVALNHHQIFLYA
jgi:hypothetical protein